MDPTIIIVGFSVILQMISALLAIRLLAPDYALVLDAMHPKSKGEFLTAIDVALQGGEAF